MFLCLLCFSVQISVQTDHIHTHCPLTLLPLHKRTINSVCVCVCTHVPCCLGVYVDVSGGQLEEGDLVFS